MKKILKQIIGLFYPERCPYCDKTVKSGEIICSRMNDAGRGEIWKVNFNTGVEECLLTDLNISFSTPAISPDGRWIACVGGTPLSTGKSTYWNTDIYR